MIHADIVAVYDRKGRPSIMRRFCKMTNKELFGGNDKVHPAFIIDGKEYDEIYISVYPNTVKDGLPYSLPMMKPKTEITFDAALEMCFDKGEGWHLMTAAEWGLLANLSLKNGTLPHGNTNYGSYHADESEKGVQIENSNKTRTGSGPQTWTHDHTIFGVHDLCGNVWEWVSGLRLKDGGFEMIQDNNAALDIDQSEYSHEWESVCDLNGKQMYASVDNRGLAIKNEAGHKGYGGAKWGNVKVENYSETLQELGIFNGEENAYLYLDSTDGEYLSLRGGGWYYGARAGVFISAFDIPRSYSHGSFGFRSAFYRKTEN